jgi:hypothetical protein
MYGRHWQLYGNWLAYEENASVKRAQAELEGLSKDISEGEDAKFRERHA